MPFRAEKIKHILVIRLSAMGDVAMSVPVVARLREDNPHMAITVMTREKFRPFFRDIADLNFLAPDFEGRHKGVKGIFRLSGDVAALGIDAVADLHDVLRTKLLRLLLMLRGRQVSVIDKGRMDKRALTRKFRKIKVQLTPTVRRYWDTIVRLGVPLNEPVPPERNPRPMSAALASIAGKKEGTWIGIAPFSLHPGKIYPPILSDALIGLLAERYSRVFIFGGGKHEQEFSECMQQRHGKVVSMIGRVGLEEEMDLISNLDCVISMDSAVMHMASIMGTPVVSVWGATHPYAGFYGFGQRPENAVQLDMPCRPCSVYGNKPCMYNDYRCLNRIPPTTILERVDRVIRGK